ncbi:hypothetical protein KUTeg_004086 [Tegillarca granosa]|uniref:Uncharacterized protein n=1 Tax=Tegillarca granosa TaxID=220873 RepID=A0ABQ9FP16_TEGGR|nr:hypothetical protein KUTeg_004086 [Tegillarca granosa]
MAADYIRSKSPWKTAKSTCESMENTCYCLKPDFKCCCKRCQSQYHSKNKKSISTTIVIDNSPASGSFNQERVHVYEALRRGENPPEPEPNQSVAQTDSRSYDQVYDYVDQERNCAPCIDQNKQRPAHPLPNDVKTPESYQIHGHAYIEMIAESDEQYDDTVVSSTGPSDNKGNRTYPKQNFGSCIQHDEFTRSSDDQNSEKLYQEPIVRSPSDNDEKEKNMANNNKNNEKSNIINDTHVEPMIESGVDRQVVSYADDGYLKPATKEIPYYVKPADGIIKTADDTVENADDTVENADDTVGNGFFACFNKASKRILNFLSLSFLFPPVMYLFIIMIIIMFIGVMITVPVSLPVKKVEVFFTQCILYLNHCNSDMQGKDISQMKDVVVLETCYKIHMAKSQPTVTYINKKTQKVQKHLYQYHETYSVQPNWNSNILYLIECLLSTSYSNGNTFQFPFKSFKLSTECVFLFSTKYFKMINIFCACIIEYFKINSN